MKFGYIGIDYKHADQDIRDRVSFTDNQKIDFCRKPGKQELNNVLCFRPAIAAKSIFLHRKRLHSRLA